MKSSSSETPAAAARKGYFCEEPWTGLFSIETNLDVTFCPCYLKLRIGNLNDAPIGEIWNAPALVEMRREFARGELPAGCKGQLCPVALGPPTADVPIK
jgi:MoaA/NifB/PqqE/SkfB family radical SAM enzyme